MQIKSVTYTTAQQDRVFVVTTRGMLTLPWPDSSTVGQAIQEWIDAGNNIAPPTTPELDKRRNEKMVEINLAYSQEMDQVLHEYPYAEELSFAQQEREAREWVKDATTDTPFIDALSTSRGLTKDEMVSRILAKSSAFAQIAGAATGKRQALEAKIKKATETELETIQW